jgi:hypothetical protein
MQALPRSAPRINKSKVLDRTTFSLCTATGQLTAQWYCLTQRHITLLDVHYITQRTSLHITYFPSFTLSYTFWWSHSITYFLILALHHILTDTRTISHTYWYSHYAWYGILIDFHATHHTQIVWHEFLPGGTRQGFLSRLAFSLMNNIINILNLLEVRPILSDYYW